MSLQSTPVTTLKIITAYEFEFVKSYLYNVYKNVFPENKLTIHHMLALNGRGIGIPAPLVVTDDIKTGLTRVVDEVVYLTISYKKHDYELMLFVDYNHERDKKHSIFILGIDDKAKDCSVLQEYIIR